MNLKIINNSFISLPPDYESYLIETELNRLPESVWLFIGNKYFHIFRDDELPDSIFLFSPSFNFDDQNAVPSAFPVNPVLGVCGECDDSEANNCIHLTTLKNYILTHSFARN